MARELARTRHQRAELRAGPILCSTCHRSWRVPSLACTMRRNTQSKDECTPVRVRVQVVVLIYKHRAAAAATHGHTHACTRTHKNTHTHTNTHTQTHACTPIRLWQRKECATRPLICMICARSRGEAQTRFSAHTPCLALRPNILLCPWHSIPERILPCSTGLHLARRES